MDQFYANFKALNDDQRRGKLDQIIGFLRQHNAHDQANAFSDLKNCYPKFPLSVNDRTFREYLAWSDISRHQNHKIVQHILSQG
jgi:hypothetical protein